MAAITKIELVSDGRGTVLVFKNGYPVREWQAEYSLPLELEDYLEQELCEYPPILEGEENERP